ncbi:MAG TPA: MerR family transcriptional regulator [Blastocatellia bacterium]|nr:MerR family transcriptional regulator [Blastocatellia bacterium]
MRIGEVATRAGVSVQAVRLYERRGILKRVARQRSGYRDYTPDTVALVRFVKQAQQHGFTLNEIKSLIDLRGTQGSGTGQARRLAEAKVAALDAQINRLKAQRDAIAHGLGCCQCSEMFPLCLLAQSGARDSRSE